MKVKVDWNNLTDDQIEKINKKLDANSFRKALEEIKKNPRELLDMMKDPYDVIDL